MSHAWTGRDHNEPFSRLYYIDAGEAEIWHHGEKYVLRPGSLYLIPPKSNMKYRCRESFYVAWVHFNISLYGCLDLFSFQDPGFAYTPRNSEAIRGEILELLLLINRRDMFSQLRAKSLLLDLIANFFIGRTDIARSIDHEKISRLTPVINYIHRHLDRRITLAELANLAAYERTYFSSIFKQVFSISPIRYIQNLRIEKAQWMLRDGNMKLSAIADELGFSDAFHFSKIFKKITGGNPSEFRKCILKRIP